MSKVFMTVLGKGPYRKCTYSLNGYEEEGRYVQKALLRILSRADCCFDRAVFFMTEESRALNWEKYVCDRNGVREEDEGMLPFLRENFPEMKIDERIIPFATSEQEMLDTFRAMYEAVQEQDEVTLDVTNGFRYMPMLFLPVISYAKELKNIKVDAIYYGAFESQEEKKPILNLVLYNNILNWANAAHSFVRYGRSEEIQDMAEEMNRQAFLKKDRSFLRIRSVANALDDFTNCIQTSRGGDIAEGKAPREASKRSMRYAYQRVQEEYEKIERGSAFSPSNNLLDHAMDSIAGFREKDFVETGIECVRWCVEKRMVQQGYTALEETILTYCCMAAGLKKGFQERDTREVVDRAVWSLGDALKTESSSKTGISEEDLRRKVAESSEEEWFQSVVKNIPLEIAGLMAAVKNRRNDINHFGMRRDPMRSSDLKENLERDLNTFLSAIGN